MTIGERIKQKRKELGLSADDVAKRIGKNRATVYRYENSEIESLPVTVLEPLAKVLQTTSAELIGTVEEPKTIDIGKELEKFGKMLESHQGLMLSGNPLSDRDRELFLNSIKKDIELTNRLIEFDNKQA